MHSVDLFVLLKLLHTFIYILNNNYNILYSIYYYYMCLCIISICTKTYLKMNINNTKSEKNTATLSIVRNITNSCRRRFGINRTSFNMRRRRNVRKTDNPELPAKSLSLPRLCANSNALKIHLFLIFFLITNYKTHYPSVQM